MPFFLLAVLSAVVTTFVVRAFALRYKALDAPDGQRKRHERAVPLWGGAAIFIAFWGVVGALLFFYPVQGLPLIQNSLIALFVGSLPLLLMGLVDDVLPLPPLVRLFFIVFALACVALWLPLQRLTNPFGGWFVLPLWLGAGLVFVWLSITTLSIKLLDGVDGLATGTVLLGALIIAAQTLSARFFQPNVALVALIFAGCLLGFWLFNAPPASIFLGESGSLFIGFMLGGLSILAGSKMATALLVMAVPVLDLVRVVVVRVRRGREPWRGDRAHLHFVLLDRGWKQWQVLTLLLGSAGLFGAAGLFLQSYQKIIALLVATVVFVLYAFTIKKTEGV